MTPTNTPVSVVPPIWGVQRLFDLYSILAIARLHERTRKMAIVMCNQSGRIVGRNAQASRGRKPDTISFYRSAIVFVLTALASLTASSIAAEAGCTVYQHRDYKGSHFALGSREALQMAGERCGATHDWRIHYSPSWNDQISSFRVTNGCTITLWEHASGCGGGGHHFRTNRSYTYIGDAWNDKTSYVECSCR